MVLFLYGMLDDYLMLDDVVFEELSFGVIDLGIKIEVLVVFCIEEKMINKEYIR